MRVLHVGKFYPPHPGGIERTTADLCSALAHENIRATVLAHADPGTWHTTSETVDDVDIVRVACPGQILYAPFSPTFPLQLSRLIARWQPDLIHIHMPNPSAFALLALRAAKRIPWIVHWHSDIPLDTKNAALRIAYNAYRPFEQALLRRARTIIATSADYRESSHALASWREKTEVIPLGIADREAVSLQQSEAQTPTWPKGDLRVLAVGRLSYFKGFDVLLRAIERVPRASLLLIGDGECASELRRLAAELRIGDRVHFAGRIDMTREGRDAISAAYETADVFCLPSTDRAESFGLVLLEAMRAARPVIASAIPGSGVNYVVRDGETGLLVQPGDAAALAASIERLRDDATLRSQFGAAGRARFLAEFTLAMSASRTAQLYRRIVSESARPGAAAPAA